MSLHITLELGADHDYVFTEDQAPIRVGRDDACHVRIAEELRSVGRMHCELQWVAGEWRLLVNHRNPVFIDGRRVRVDEAIRRTASMVLGSTDGPELLIRTQPESGRLSTFIVATQSGLLTILRRIQRQSRVMIFLWAASAIALAALGAWMYAARPPDFKAVLEKTMASTYQVLERGRPGEKGDRGESPRGTAWVVGPGVLATNAHVAELFYALPPGHQLVVRAPGTAGREHRIRAVLVHPAFSRFFRAWVDYAPRVRNPQGVPVPLQSIGGYDAGLLFVDEAEHLAPPLTIADDQTLESLSAGEEVAYAGFPVGGHRPVNSREPVHVTHRGTVSAVTDFFFRPAKKRQLVQHSLAASHGASGSPIVNADGHVVAVLSGGNVVLIPDPTGGQVFVPTGPGIYFAHRADLVRDLLLGRFDLGALQKEWMSALCSFETLEPVDCPNEPRAARVPEP